MDYKKYVCIVVIAVVVAVLGYWNPTFLQEKDANGAPTGCQNFWYVSLAVLILGCLCQYVFITTGCLGK
jgi:hypothetical protein